MPPDIELHRLGTLPYRDAWTWQRHTADALRNGGPEALALVQHPHVVTFGRRVHRENLLTTPPDTAVVESDRGGDITYHGPGQIVAYPILDLRARSVGAACYVWHLEEVMLRTAAAFGIEAHRVAGRPGAWLGDAKLGAIGVRVQRGITTHGLSLNVDPDLARFDAIVPCGLPDVSVTSLARELISPPDHTSVEDTLITAFETVFESHLNPVPNRPQPLSEIGEGRAALSVRSTTHAR